ncbi:hypothetical protein FRC05_007421 [Tulasnella sp. 425]|nr:hypothetical protein FRC05_007421 [Tulasnella sp. 425]
MLPETCSNDIRNGCPQASLGGFQIEDSAPTIKSSLAISHYDHVIRTTNITLAQLRSAARPNLSDIRQAEQLRADQACARNAFLPIYSLPDELLTTIWKYVTYDSYLRGIDGAWVLAQVSKAWANIILSSSEPWCDINSEFSQQRTQLALQKSTERPLNVSLGSGEDVAERFNLVLPHCHRWRELRLAVGLPEITITLRVISMPMLKHLELRARPDVEGTQAELPNMQASPMLRTLSLDRVSANWPSPSIPVGLRSLVIRNIRRAPTISQLLALLSSTPQLEDLQLERIDIRSTGGPPIGEQKPLNMPCLQRVRISHMARQVVTALLSLIRTNQCHHVFATPIELSTLPHHARRLTNLLSKISSSTRRIFVEIDNSSNALAVVSSIEAKERSSVLSATGGSGFVLEFRSSGNYQDIQNIVSFLAYTPIPISLSIRSREYWLDCAVAEMDWDQLPSLQQLEIQLSYPEGLSPILDNLSKPRGPRHYPRWPCPNLSVLKFPGVETVPDGFMRFLLGRWGPPAHDGLKIDSSRPVRLSLCHGPKGVLSKYPFCKFMGHFAEVWEDPRRTPPEDESTTDEGCDSTE